MRDDMYSGVLLSPPPIPPASRPLWAPLSRGVTLVELLVVIALMALLATIASAVLGGFTTAQTLAADAAAASSLLEQAHTDALTGASGEPHGVHFDSSAGTLTSFAGSSYTPDDPQNVVYSLYGGIVIHSITLAGGGSDVVFDQLTGDTSENGSVVLAVSSDASRQKTIQISSVGVMNVQ
ncbi:MAG: pilus assembly FimT family protein [Minisyncoccia bacterium]